MSVAAVVTPAPSAKARRAGDGGAARTSPEPAISSAIGRASSRIPVTAAKLSCQLTSPAERGFSRSVTATASSSAYQRHRGLSASIATTPAAPMIPALWMDGPAPVTGT